MSSDDEKEEKSQASQEESFQVHEGNVISVDDLKDEGVEKALNQPETTRKELWGWYLYDLAQSVYFNTGIYLFIFF